MSIRERFVQENPGYIMQANSATESTSLAIAGARFLVREGIHGLRELYRRSSPPDTGAVLERNSRRELTPEEIDEFMTELGGVVLGTRLQYQETIFKDGSFPYRDFVSTLQSSVQGAGWELPWADPFPELGTIDLGTQYPRAVQRYNAGDRNLNLRELHEPFVLGQKIQEAIKKDPSLSTLATDLTLLPPQVFNFMNTNNLEKAEDKIIPRYTKIMKALYPNK